MTKRKYRGAAPLVQLGSVRAGDVLHLPGQVYRVEAVGEHTSLTGKPWIALQYSSACPECGEPIEGLFALRREPKRFYPIRRCRAHAQKGVPVKDVFG